MHYLLFLRGINVGGKNRVSMTELKAALNDMPLSHVFTYINSGNIGFASDLPRKGLDALLTCYFQTAYPFPIPYALIEKSDYLRDFEALPAWWNAPMARRDVLFFTEPPAEKTVVDTIAGMTLVSERVHIGRTALFWVREDEAALQKTAYHRQLILSPLYKQVTIRNANTCGAMRKWLMQQG